MLTETKVKKSFIEQSVNTKKTEYPHGFVDEERSIEKIAAELRANLVGIIPRDVNEELLKAERLARQ
jgi:hypothetical protein